MQIQDEKRVQLTPDGAQSLNTLQWQLAPEINGSTKGQAAQQILAQSESLKVDSSIKATGRESDAFSFALTDVLTPEILKQGGLEAAVLLLMQERKDMFEGTLTSRLSNSKAGQERLLEQSKDRLEKMREAIQEMDKAKKSGKFAEVFGWVGLGASGLAAVLTAGAASPAFVAASLALFAVQAGLQIDSATGGNFIKLAGDDPKQQMALSIGLSAAMMIVSGGIGGLTIAGKMGSASAAASKSGGAIGGAASSADDAARVGSAVAGGADDAARATGGVLGGGSKTGSIAKDPVHRFWQNIVAPNGDVAKATRLFDTGDHWTQKGAAAVSVGVEMSSSVSSIRAAYSRRQASMLSSESLEMRAIEKRLSTYMDFIGQIIEDVLAQIQSGNRTLAKQLSISFDQKEAILANV